MQEVLTAAASLAALALLGFIGILGKNLPAILEMFSAWLKLQIDQHQQGRVEAAARTAAGIIQTKIDQGDMTIQDVRTENKGLQQVVSDALVPVKESAAAQKATVESVSRMVIGMTDTAPPKQPVLVKGIIP